MAKGGLGGKLAPYMIGKGNAGLPTQEVVDYSKEKEVTLYYYEVTKYAKIP